MSQDVAIDLGTANTLVYARGQGIVLNEPSVVAFNTSTGAVLAVGADAKQLIGRTPSYIRAMRPIKDGVVSHLGATEKMLRYFIRKVRGRWSLPRPRVVVCVPTGLTEVEQRAVQEAAKAGGAGHAYLIEEPMAAAIGAGLPIQDPEGVMVVDIGGGTTEVAIISFGGIVTSTSVRVGGDELDEAIVQYVKKVHSVSIGERTAEEIKLAIASASDRVEGGRSQAIGRDMVAGLPKAVDLGGEEIRQAIEEPLAAIVDAVRATLDQCPPELAGDIMRRGVVMAGGGALLRGLPERLGAETGLPVLVADEPLECVAIGAGRCLEHFSNLKPLLASPRSVGRSDV
jgi:rod shape-determining protein MreB and related proteins